MDIMTVVSWSILVWFCFALGSCYNTLCGSDNGNGFPKCRWPAPFWATGQKSCWQAQAWAWYFWTQKSWPIFHLKWRDFFTSWWNWACIFKKKKKNRKHCLYFKFIFLSLCNVFGYIFISSLYPRVINFLLSNKNRDRSVTPSFKAKAFT